MNRHKNRGQISVFACAMICVFLILILTVLQCIRLWEGKAKSEQAVVAATSSLKGDFQPDLFRRYHLLALDRTYYGRGEGYLEERVKKYLEFNLIPSHGLYNFQVQEAMLSDVKTLVENEQYGFRQQIQTYMEQRLPIAVVEEVIEKENGQESSQGRGELLAGLEEARQEEGVEFSMDSLDHPTNEQLRLSGLEEILNSQGIADTENITVEDLMNMNLAEQELLTDPQSALESLMGTDILYLVMPEQVMTVSRNQIPTTGLPSRENAQNHADAVWFENERIQSVSELTAFLSQNLSGPSFDDLSFDTAEVYGITYALDSFQYLGNTEKGDMDTEDEYHALEFEVEYMIAGQLSDYENLSKIAEELCLLRLVPNAAYAFTNQEMKDTALLLSALILAPIGLAGVVKPASYVFLACWAYGESIMDVRCLFQGECVPIMKDKDSWQLSLNNLQNIATEEASGCDRENGLNYEEHLMLLLAVMPDSGLKYDRMLDLMQLNIQQKIPQFQIKNCIYGFQLQAEISENRSTWYFEEKGSYLP